MRKQRYLAIFAKDRHFQFFFLQWKLITPESPLQCESQCTLYTVREPHTKTNQKSVWGTQFLRMRRRLRIAVHPYVSASSTEHYRRGWCHKMSEFPHIGNVVGVLQREGSTWVKSQPRRNWEPTKMVSRFRFYLRKQGAFIARKWKIWSR